MTEKRVETSDLNAMGTPYWSLRYARELAGDDVDGALVLITADGLQILPVAQFRSTADGVSLRPGLSEFFAALEGVDPWTVLTYLHTPLIEWQSESMSVLEASERGVPADVLRATGERLARDLKHGWT